MGAAVAVPAIISVASAVIKNQGEKKKAEAVKQAQKKQLVPTSQAGIANTGNWLFPGSIPTPTGTPTTAASTRPSTPTAQAAAPDFMQEWIKSLSGPSPQGSISYDAPQARAMGGPVNAGQPYVVGEQGPEVMTPQTSGQITPNAQTQAATPYAGLNPAMSGGGGPGTVSTGVLQSLPGLQAQAAQRTQAAGQTTAVPAPAPPGANTPGNAVMQAIMSYFNNPGQMSPVTYERAQEQANIGENSAKSAATQGLTGRGIDPNSPMGAALASAASLGAGRQRNEAARDYSLAQEGLRRQDIQSAMASYFNVLNAIFGLAGQ